MDIKKHDKSKYWLRDELAAGEAPTGEEFSVSLNLGAGHCLIFMFPEATYTVSLRTLTDAVLDFRESDA